MKIKNSDIDILANPDAIWVSVLRKHFSCSQYSYIPLQDTNLPKEQEDPYEYWLRLNRAADTATEGLKEQGKANEDLSTDITRMFIRNCPSNELAFTFRAKTIDKLSAPEVQDVLNDYHAEMSFKATEEVHRETSERISEQSQG